MEKLIYTKRSNDLPIDAMPRNPTYFRGVERGVKHVVIEGDHPAIADAYKKAKVAVDVVKLGGDEGKSVSESPAKPLNVPQIKAALAEKGIEIPEGVTKRDDLKALLDSKGE